MILVEQIEHLPILGNLLFGELYGRLFDALKWLVRVPWQSPLSHCVFSGCPYHLQRVRDFLP